MSTINTNQTLETTNLVSMYDIPMPKGNGTFTIFADGDIAGKPESTSIQEWTYLVTTQILIVQFKSSPKEYYYEAVPVSKVFQMLASDSIGSFIAKVIKPHHEVWTPVKHS